MTWNVFAWEGDGMVLNPYQIATADDLVELSAQSTDNNFTGVYFEQTQDIDMSDITFTPVSQSIPFNGYFDGKNHQIKNLQISLPHGSYVGLFGTPPIATSCRLATMKMGYYF